MVEGTPANSTAFGNGIFANNGLMELIAPVALYGNKQKPGIFNMPVNGPINLENNISYVYIGANVQFGEVTDISDGVTFSNNNFKLPMNADGTTIPAFNFTVTYSDENGMQFQRTDYVELYNIVAHDSTLYVGQTWNPSSNLDSTTQGYYANYDENGAPANSTQANISVSYLPAAVDTSTPGVTRVIYYYGAQYTPINVTVLANQSTITGQDQTGHVGDPVPDASNFVDKLTDPDGNLVDNSEVTADTIAKLIIPQLAIILLP